VILFFVLTCHLKAYNAFDIGMGAARLTQRSNLAPGPRSDFYARNIVSLNDLLQNPGTTQLIDNKVQLRHDGLILERNHYRLFHGQDAAL
jgi:hypothetical protein